MDKVFVGKIVNTHGVKGEVRIKSDFELKSEVFVVGKKLIISDTPYEILTYRVHKDFDMVLLSGVNDLNEAILLKGKNVFINRDDIKIETDYLLEDLIGAKVVLDNTCIGTIKDYITGKNPLLIVENEKEFYIPINNEFINSFNKNEHTIYVNPIVEGLIK